MDFCFPFELKFTQHVFLCFLENKFLYYLFYGQVTKEILLQPIFRTDTCNFTNSSCLESCLENCLKPVLSSSNYVRVWCYSKIIKLVFDESKLIQLIPKQPKRDLEYFPSKSFFIVRFIELFLDFLSRGRINVKVWWFRTGPLPCLSPFTVK